MATNSAGSTTNSVYYEPWRRFMLSILGTHTLNEWIALIQQEPDQAKQHMIWLKARRKQRGLMADPSLTISIEDYDRAQQLLASATSDPQHLQEIEARAKVGRMTLGKLPDREDWRALIDADPDLAEKVCAELELKHAMLMIDTPPALLRSIEGYRTIIAEQHI
jgi:hypothetical protein